MRFNNLKLTRYVPVIYFLILLLYIAVCILYFSLQNFLFTDWFTSINLFFVLLIIYCYFNLKYFEYDGLGATLSFTNRGGFLSEYWNYKNKKAEFPKQKLDNFKIKNYFFIKILELQICSKTTKRKRAIQFNISFLSKKKIGYLQNELHRILENKTFEAN
ncbi:hypothetical protein [Mesonia sp. HuA40]|uniref:hypothetical protein n=1 Tax=Mesonia sp. HuA40 TaxID=2602761 RepID=UPI0011CAEC47|nr:hypothetical protein [Mesonia sp. HuA40]TXK70936.1 hypothetical protein FT993_10140 [Mesonia sp. HuA40]